MSPRHVRGIGRKTPPAISRIRAEEGHSRHLSAKAIIKDVANRALRKARHRINAQHRIALSRRLIQRRVALELCAAGPVLVRQGDV